MSLGCVASGSLDSEGRHCGLDGQGLVSVEVFNVGGWLTHGDYAGMLMLMFWEEGSWNIG